MYPVTTMCRVLEVSTSGYYAWLKRSPSKRAVADAALTEMISEIHTMSAGAYGALMWRVGRGGIREETIEAIVRSARTTVGVPMIEAEARMLQTLAEEILRCRKAASKARADVERLSEAHEAAGRMGQTIGKATAAVMVSKAGDPRDYASASSLVKSLGLNLKERSSGKYKGQLKITKRGPSVCRYYLYLAALRLIQDDPVVRAWYGKKVVRDGGRMKNKAVIAVTRKLVKGLWHVARGEPFDSRLLFDVNKLDQVQT